MSLGNVPFAHSDSAPMSFMHRIATDAVPHDGPNICHHCFIAAGISGSVVRFRRQISCRPLLLGDGFCNSISANAHEKDLGWQMGVHPRPVKYVSTRTARRSRCSSPPRGLYHSRRTLWKTTQAIKTKPAATDGINIKFSSVMDPPFAQQQLPQNRCGNTTPPERVPQWNRLRRRTPACPGHHAKPDVSQAHSWTLPRQLCCTSANAIGWPFVEAMFLRLLGKYRMSQRR